MIVTRFNPSCNGGLHLGHIYMALINEQIAHEAGGKFVVRFDDCGEPVLSKVGIGGASAVSYEMKHDLSWLGIEVDQWVWQSEIMPEVHAELERRGVEIVVEPELVVTPEWLGLGNERLMYPYTPRKTPEKVLMDALEGVNLLIRGEDLITEYSLYEHYRESWHLPEVRHVYLPPLVAPFGAVGKTMGGYQVGEYRTNGWTAQAVRDLVSRSCLKWPANGWHLENVKSLPRLEI